MENKFKTSVTIEQVEKECKNVIEEHREMWEDKSFFISNTGMLRIFVMSLMQKLKPSEQKNGHDEQ